MTRGTVAIPATLDEVTPGWLSAALSARGTPVTVTGFEIDKVLDGTAAKMRLAMSYENGGGAAAGLPSRMWVKGGYGGERDKILPTGAYAAEARFYRDLRDRLPVNAPDCYFAACDEDTLQGISLIEDLERRGVRFCYAPDPLSADEAARVLELLAAQHAFWWDDPELKAIGWLQSPLEPGTGPDRYASGFSPADVDRFLELPRARPVPKSVTGGRIVRALRAFQEWVRTGPSSLLHGDCHLGNLFIQRDGRPGWYDWQTVWRGNWAHDVGYFIVTALRPEDRRRHEKDLLRHYLDRLAAAGADPPPWDAAWADYRRSLAYGLFIWVIDPVEAQPDEVNAPNIERFLAAADDLDAFGCHGI